MAVPVLLTGATGFLGRRLAAAMARSGRPVHALVRAGSELDGLAGLDARTYVGDVTDAASVARALEGASLAAPGGQLDVVHAAAVISYRTGDAALQRRVNVEGTWNVLDAARRAGVRRVVHVGSIAAVGHRTGPELVHEDMPWNAAGLAVDYATTKRAADDLALLAAREQDITVVDPGALFGPGPARSNSVHLLGEIARGRRIRLAPPGGMAVLGVEDCAEGIVRALERGRRGQRYLLVESSHAMRDLLAILARALGAAPPGPAAPRALWSALTRAVALLDRLSPRERLTPQALRMSAADWSADGSKARRELGFRPRPFEEVIADTVRELGLAAPGAPRLPGDDARPSG